MLCSRGSQSTSHRSFLIAGIFLCDYTGKLRSLHFIYSKRLMKYGPPLFGTNPFPQVNYVLGSSTTLLINAYLSLSTATTQIISSISHFQIRSCYTDQSNRKVFKFSLNQLPLLSFLNLLCVKHLCFYVVVCIKKNTCLVPMLNRLRYFHLFSSRTIAVVYHYQSYQNIINLVHPSGSLESCITNRSVYGGIFQKGGKCSSKILE